MDRNIRSNMKRFLLILVVILMVFFMLIIKAFDTAKQVNKLQNKQVSIAENESFVDKVQDEQNEQNANEVNSEIDVEHHVSLMEQEQNIKVDEKTKNHTVEMEQLEQIEENNQSASQEESKLNNLTQEQEIELAFLSAQKLKQNKEYVKALEGYKSILEKNVNNEVNAKCYEEMAGIYGVVKRYGTALSYAQKAYSIAPSSNRELLIARLYYKTGDIDKATKKINNILQRDFAIDN